MKLGVVTGLQRESQCLLSNPDSDNLIIKCAGARPAQAETCASELLAEGCGALMSFGIAGGLSPELSAGQVVLADNVCLPDGNVVPTSGNWRERLLASLPRNGSIVVGPVAGCETIVADAEAKNRLYKETDALVVDMESHRVARVAAEAGVPFLVIRSVSDAFDQSIPRTALGSIDENGSPLYFKVIGGLIKRPGDLRGLMRLSKDSESALASLRRVALLAGRLFRFA
jgi:adenosylhomocysteine nucleosidase